MTRPTRLGAPPSPRTLVPTLALLAALIVLPLALAPRAEAFIYWPIDVRKGPLGIARANLDGTQADYSFIEGIQSAGTTSIAVDARYIYWTGSGQANAPEPDVAIARARLDGTKTDWTFIPHAVGPSEGIGQIAVGDDHIYWARNFGPPGSTGWVIDRANLDGTGVEKGFIPGLAQGAVVTGIAVDANHIYWSQTGGMGPTSTPTAAIGRANLDGTGVEKGFIPFPNGTEPVGVEVDAAHIYWNWIRRDPSSQELTIGRANLDGTGVNQSFIGGFAYGYLPVGLAVDAGHIYWTKPAHNAIARANLDGSAVAERFMTEAIFGQGIAVNISLGELKRDKKNGTAKLTVEVPAPGGITLSQTKKLKGTEEHAEAAGEVQLAIKPRGSAKEKLAEDGKAKVRVEVTYTPDGGEHETQTTTLKLVKRG